MEPKFVYELGVEVKDQITDFKGIIIGRTQYLFGCNCYGVSSKALKNGEIVSAQWFDEGRLVVTGKGIKPEKVKAEKNGSEYHEHPNFK